VCVERPCDWCRIRIFEKVNRLVSQALPEALSIVVYADGMDCLYNPIAGTPCSSPCKATKPLKECSRPATPNRVPRLL